MTFLRSSERGHSRQRISDPSAAPSLYRVVDGSHTLPSQPSIVYLLGHPGVGKYTVGQELARQTGAVLIDNQVINHPIIALFDWDGTSLLPLGTEDWMEPI